MKEEANSNIKSEYISGAEVERGLLTFNDAHLATHLLAKCGEDLISTTYYPGGITEWTFRFTESVKVAALVFEDRRKDHARHVLVDSLIREV